MVVPLHWSFYKAQLSLKLSKSVESKLLKEYKSHIELPEDRDWLDQRKHPVYPLVHAPKDVVKAYNTHLKYYSAPPYKRAPIQDKPNVVFLLIESFGPSPWFYNTSFVKR